MSRFFVGQRVRLVVAYNYPERIGEEVYVTGILSGSSVVPFMLKDDASRRFCDEDALTTTGDGWGWMHQYEPATDANTVISFEECIWKPDHLRSRVEVGP